MENILRCKLRVGDILYRKNFNGDTITNEIVKLFAVVSTGKEDPNSLWSSATPYATFEITISNPKAFGKLKIGQEYFIDFSDGQELPLDVQRGIKNISEALQQ